MTSGSHTVWSRLSSAHPWARLASAGRRSGALAAADVVTAVGGVALGVLIAHALGAVQYGIYVAAVAATNVGLAIADLGLQRICIRELSTAKEADGGLVGTAIALRTTLFLPCLLVVAGAHAAPGASTGDVYAAVGIGAWLGLGSLAMLLRAPLWARGELGSEAVARVIRYGAGAALVAGSAVLWPHSLRSVATGLAAASLLELAWTTWLVRRRTYVSLRAATWANARRLVKMGLPLGVSSLMLSLYGASDLLYVARFRGPEEAGWLSVALSLTSLCQVLPAAAATALLPDLSRLFDVNPSAAQRAALAGAAGLFLAGAVLAATLAAVAGPAIHLVFGAEFGPAARAVHVLALALPPIFATQLLSSALVAFRRQYWLPAVNAGGALAKLALGPSVIPLHGFIGATVLIVGAEIVVLAACLALAITRVKRGAP